MNIKKQPIYIALATGLCLFIVLASITFTQQSKVVLLLKSQKESKGQLFWKSGSDKFNERNSIKFNIIKDYNTYQFAIDGNETQEFRLDPGFLAENEITLSCLKIQHPGFLPISVPIESVRSDSGTADICVDNELHFMSKTETPALRFTTPPLTYKIDWALIVIYLSVSVFMGVIIYFSANFIQWYRPSTTVIIFVAGMFIAFCLSFTMAFKAKFNGSPDELDHYMAAEFFKTNSYIPQKDSEEGIYTYNILWSYSRVYLPGIDYVYAGKFSNFISSAIPSYITVRLWGVAMILFLIFLAFRFSKLILILLPFLFTPQVWYIFSYINDDYFPLFLSFVLMIVGVASVKYLRRSEMTIKTVTICSFIGIFLGLLFISKQNYLIFFGFYAVFLLTLPFRFSRSIMHSLRRLWVAYRSFYKTPLLIVSILALTVCAKNALLNSSESKPLTSSSRCFLQTAEKKREFLFSTKRSGESRYNTYGKMMKIWIPEAYKSFNGNYGYLVFYGSETFYRRLIALHIFVICAVMFLTFKYYGHNQILRLFVYGGFVAVMFFASSYTYAYKYDFQPQGKYLFPLLPIIGLYLYQIRHRINMSLLIAFVIIFFMSVYSFILYGLTNLSIPNL